jgi:segregation and condensation protein B
MPYGPATLRPQHIRPVPTVRPGLLSFPFDSTKQVDDPFARSVQLAKVEAAFWLADEPLTSKKLATVTGLADGREAKRLIDQLRHLYEAEEAPFQIELLAGGYQLLTKPVFQPWLLRLRRLGHEARLAPSSMETLAIIAYKQPITRADVESIRGVSAVEPIRQLTEKDLIAVVGKQKSLGRPQLYGTTKKFLQLFGLNDLAELPEVAAFGKG